MLSSLKAHVRERKAEWRQGSQGTDQASTGVEVESAKKTNWFAWALKMKSIFDGSEQNVFVVTDNQILTGTNWR